jgi:hypothetical protein
VEDAVEFNSMLDLQEFEIQTIYSMNYKHTKMATCFGLQGSYHQASRERSNKPLSIALDVGGTWNCMICDYIIGIEKIKRYS